MAVDFPLNPSHGDVFGPYTFDGTVPSWRSTPETASGMPAGSIMAWGSDVAPTNWLLCNGTAISRTTYASLFAAIGVTYGVGDGATTFNLPDLRGKLPVGKDSTQTEFDLLGETGGNKATAKYGDGTSTGYGATYSSSLGAGDLTASNLQPYQVVNYIIKASAGVSIGDSELATRLGVVENKFNTGQNDVPAGSITQFAGATIPTNWLLCDGSAVSRATWPSLYAAISTTYGAGDGSTTFNLPDIPNGDAAGIISTLRINSQVTVTTTLTDLSGITSTVNLKAGRTYRITFSSPNLNMSNTGRARFDILANGTLLSRDYVGVAASIGGVAFNVQTLYTPSADGSYVVKVAGMVDAGTATTMTVYADGNSTTLFNIEDMGESAGSALRTKSIIKATAGIATNESAFATRVGAVETVNDTQNTRLTTLEYNSPNYLINGAFDIWQRGVGPVTPAGYQTADRWYGNAGGTTSFSQETTNVPTGFRYAYKMTLGTTTACYVEQAIETFHAVALAGQTVALSNYMVGSVGQSVALQLYYSTSTDVGPTGSWTLAGSSVVSVTTSWARYSTTISVPSTAKSLKVSFVQQGSNASGVSLYIAGAQLESGSIATGFRRHAGSIQGELAACQRYYQRYIGGVGCGFFGAANSATGILGSFNLPVVMRAIPGASASGLIWVSDQYLTDQQATSASVAAQQGYNTNGGRIVLSGFSGLTTGRWYSAPAASIGSGYIDFNAEL